VAIRQTVRYTGRVQGVGFRFTTTRIAEHHPVGGYVRNQPDGSVELVVEGEAAAVRAFRDELESAMAGNIRDVRADQSPATGEFDGEGGPVLSVRH